MNGKTVSSVTLVLLVTSMLVLAVRIQPVRAIGTITINAEGSITPSTAPIQRNWDTYALISNVASDADGIHIERDNIILDGAGYTMTGSGTGSGVTLTSRSGVTVRNMAIGSFTYGISLGSSSGNTLSGNTVNANTQDGISLDYSSSGNFIFHNSFVNNPTQAATDGSANIWDNGYPSGGNYWSDYATRYPNAAEIDNSGLWNTPCVIDANNKDNYPLISPWGSPPTYVVTINGHCNTEGIDIAVPITEDGSATGYTTPHRFIGLSGYHTFTVWGADASGHPFLQWSTCSCQTSPTIIVAVGGTYTAYYQAPPPTYNVTINAHCNTESVDVSVPITMDISSSGHSTAYTFTGLTGTHIFTVPSADASGHPFQQWSTSQISTTIAVTSGGTYTAYYQGAPPPTYAATISAHCNTEGVDVIVSIVMDGTSTGDATPHTFTGLTGSHTFTVPNSDSNGHPFKQWNAGQTTTTLTVTSGGTYTANYEAPPPPNYAVTVNAHCNTEGMDVSVAIMKDRSLTGFSTSHTFLALTGSHTFSVPSADNSGHPFLQWSTGQTSTTITVTSAGTYTAYYDASTILVTDLNRDGKVDIQDFTIVAVAYGSRTGDSKWNPIADFNKDGVINILDISIVAKDYGKTV